MNLDLKVGLVIKNYPELCKILGVKSTKGKGREYHFKELSRHCTYHIQGQKIYIDEVYTEPKPKVDERKGNSGKSEGSRNNYKGIYAEYIDVLLIEYLIKEESNLKDTCKIYTTNNKIAEATGIVNYNYRTAFSNQEKFYNTVKKEFDIKTNTYCMRDVFVMVKTKIREIVKASLDRLQKAEQLEYETCYFVYMSPAHRPPNESELDAILTAEEEAMKEMGIEHKKQIDNNPKLSKEFNFKVLKKVQEKFIYIKGIYKGYTIVLWKDFELKSNNEINLIMKKLNNLVIASLNEKPPKTYEKTKEESGEGWFGSRNPFWEPWVYDRLSNRYIQHCYDFIYVLCNINAENITEKIINCKDDRIIDGLTQKQKDEINNNLKYKLIDKVGYDN